MIFYRQNNDILNIRVFTYTSILYSGTKSIYYATKTQRVIINSLMCLQLYFIYFYCGHSLLLFFLILILEISLRLIEKFTLIFKRKVHI